MDIRLGLVSAYSLLYGVHKPEALLDRALSFGVNTVSICDRDNLYGVHSFLEAARERKIRPIIGVTLNAEAGAVYCFVESRAGFSRLCELLTLRNKDKDSFAPLPLLRENSRGLVLASPDEGTLSALAGKVKRLYAAITPLSSRAVGPGRRLGIPLAFLDNSVFIEAGDMAVHHVLRAIGLLKTVGNLKPEDCAHNDSVLRSSKELHRRLVSWPDAVKGTRDNRFHIAPVFWPIPCCGRFSA